MSKFRVFHYNSSKKGAREMILTFLDFFRRGLPNHKKINFLGGPAHFVTYGDGDGLVDNNNALTTMASALKSVHFGNPRWRPAAIMDFEKVA
jgi:hypothetical protein